MAIDQGLRLDKWRVRKGQERGAVLVEAAIGLVILAMFAFAILEYGRLYGETLDVQGAVRASTRAGAATGAGAVGDEVILRALTSGPNGTRADIEKVVIYEATNVNGGPPAQCRNAVNDAALPNSVRCNIYVDSELTNPSSYAGLAAARNWTALQRQPSVQYLGVWVQVKHKRLSTLVPSPARFSDYSVMRLEPTVQVDLVGGTWSTGSPDSNMPWSDNYLCWPSNMPQMCYGTGTGTYVPSPGGGSSA